MTKVLVLYYSSYGHIEQMADAVAEGARAAGAGTRPKWARKRCVTSKAVALVACRKNRSLVCTGARFSGVIRTPIEVGTTRDH